MSYVFDNLSVKDFLGRAYLPLPRKVLELLFQGNVSERKLAAVYVALLYKAFVFDGYVTVNKHVYVCKRGEYVGTYNELAFCTGLSKSNVGHILHRMQDLGLITMNQLKDATRFFVCSYDDLYALQPGKATDKEPAASAVLEEAERRMGGRSMQFDDPDERMGRSADEQMERSACEWTEKGTGNRTGRSIHGR